MGVWGIKNSRATRERRASHEFNTEVGGHEVNERGMFDFLGKKEEEKLQEDQAIATEFEKAQVTESEDDQRKELEEEEKPSLMEKLHRSHSSSSTSSSSEEEEGEGEKKKKKKEKKKICEEEKEEHHEEGTHAVPDQEEKKGFIEKIGEKVVHIMRK